MKRNPIAKACAPLRASAMFVALIATCFWASMESIQATEPEIDVNGDSIAPPFEGASIDLSPFRTNQNLTLAVESPDEAAEADELAKKLNNPISSLISVPFQVKLGFQYRADRTATDTPSTSSRSYRYPSARIGTSSSGRSCPSSRTNNVFGNSGTQFRAWAIPRRASFSHQRRLGTA